MTQIKFILIRDHWKKLNKCLYLLQFKHLLRNGMNNKTWIYIHQLKQSYGEYRRAKTRQHNSLCCGTYNLLPDIIVEYLLAQVCLIIIHCTVFANFLSFDKYWCFFAEPTIEIALHFQKTLHVIKNNKQNTVFYTTLLILYSPHNRHCRRD